MNLQSKLVDITPTRPVELAGHSQSNLDYQQIDSALEANVIMLSDEHTVLVLVGVDTLFVGGTFHQQILNNIDRSVFASKKLELCMYSTHTHTAPALDESKPVLGKVNCEYFQKSALAICDAITDLCLLNDPQQLGSIASSIADCHESVYRRKLSLIRMPRSIRYRIRCAMNPNFDVPSLKQLRLAEMRSVNGDIIACVWSWPCHPISHNNILAVSADFPGVVRNYLRNVYGNEELAVIYLPGTAGDIRPRFIKKKSLRDFISQPFSRQFSDSNHEYQNNFENRLIDAVQVAVETVQVVQVGTCPTIKVKKASVTLNKLIAGYKRIRTTRCNRLNHPATEVDNIAKLTSDSSGEDSLVVRRIAIGPLLITDANAELCSPYDSFNEPKQVSFITGYSENSFGYLPCNEQLEAGGYEVDEFFTYFSIKGKYLSALNQQFKRLLDATKV